MVGQKQLLKNLDVFIDNNTFPRFSILVGPAGSEKTEVCYYAGNKLHAIVAECGCAVDEVRKIISTAYSVAMPMLYIVVDADNMSPSAKNALLKVTEEPPQNAYFMLTLTSLENTLSTIRSRGVVFFMNPYSVTELLTYGDSKRKLTDAEISIITNICETPGEVSALMSAGIEAFYNYVEKVIDNVAVVTGTNAFKIADKLAFKDTDTDKYNLKLFWKAFMSICADRLRDDPPHYAEGIQITSKYIQQLGSASVNKSYTFDMWLLDIRKAWM